MLLSVLFAKSVTVKTAIMDGAPQPKLIMNTLPASTCGE